MLNKSFSIICGVETIIFADSHIFSRLSGNTVPVKVCIREASSVSTSFKNAECCSTKGLVGARKRIFPFASRSSITKRATVVLPNPVGKTTIKDSFFATSAMDIWYFLFSTKPSFRSGCDTNFDVWILVLVDIMHASKNIKR